MVAPLLRIRGKCHPSRLSGVVTPLDADARKGDASCTSRLTTPLGVQVHIPITVHIPEHRVDEFNTRFAEFILDVPDPGAPIRLPSGTVPAWVETAEAPSIAAKLWDEISLPGKGILRHLIEEARNETAYLLPKDLADLSKHPTGASGVAGALGGIGKAIRRAGVPLYTTPSGDPWHYIWGWDGKRYSMTPEVAGLLRKAAHN